MNNAKEISDFIIRLLQRNGTLTGAKIANGIRRKFPGIDLKNEYGGIRNFMQVYCRKTVREVTRQGQDYVYGLNQVGNNLFREKSFKSIRVRNNFSLRPSSLREMLEVEDEPGDITEDRLDDISVDSPKAESVTRPKNISGEIWRSFINPNLNRSVIVATATGDLSFESSESKLSNEYVRIDSLSHEDYKVIARDFVSSLEEERQAEFQEALFEDDFWPPFSTLLQKYEGEGMLGEWFNWKADKIREHFQRKLEDLGLAEEILKRISNSLKRSKPWTPKNIWQNFTNGNSSSLLVVDKLTGELTINTGEGKLAENSIYIEPVSHEDNLDIANEFVSGLDDSLKPNFRKSLEQEDYWPPFSALLKKNVELNRKWQKWRIEKFEELFQNRLSFLDISEDIVKIGVDSFNTCQPEVSTSKQLHQSELSEPYEKAQQSKQSGQSKSTRKIIMATAQKATPARPTVRADSVKQVVRINKSEENLRNIVHNVVDTLSEAELRQIWLPLGAVFDTLKPK
jgi:hypothetical protein